VFKKESNYSFVLMAATVLIFAGCGQSKPGEKIQVKAKAAVKSVPAESSPRATSVGDTNNSVEEAEVIPLGEPFELVINPVKDQDWFKVDLPGQGYLQIQASNVAENLGPEARFAVYDEWADVKMQEIRGWHRLPDACFIPKAGTYHFVIGDDFNDAASEQPMKIQVTFLEEFDASEPNNTPEQATPVNLGDVKKIAIFPVEDQDWFKIAVDRQGYLDVKFKGHLEKIAPEVRYALYDEWADPKIKTVRDWKHLPDACAVVAGKEYYLTILDDFNDQTEKTVFDVKFDFIEEMDSFEPNNDYPQAKPLAVGQVIKVAVFPMEDFDVFQLNAGPSDTLTVSARDVPEGIVAEVKLYTATEGFDEPQEASDWSRLPAEFEVHPGQDYYLYLHDDFNDQAEAVLFDIKVEGNAAPAVQTEEDETEAAAMKPATKDESDTAEPATGVDQTEEQTGDEAVEPVAQEAEETVDGTAEDQALSEEEQQKREAIIAAQKERQQAMAERRRQMQERQAAMQKRQAAMQQRRKELERKRQEAMEAMP